MELLPLGYTEAIRQPEKGPNEILYKDHIILVERKNNQIIVTGIGEIKSPLIFA